jgi:hypothetical protein
MVRRHLGSNATGCMPCAYCVPLACLAVLIVALSPKVCNAGQHLGHLSIHVTFEVALVQTVYFANRHCCSLQEAIVNLRRHCSISRVAPAPPCVGMQHAEVVLRKQRVSIEWLAAYLLPSELEAVARASVFAVPSPLSMQRPLWAAVPGIQTSSSRRSTSMLVPGTTM